MDAPPSPAPFRRARRAAALEVSEIVRVSEQARTLKAQGRDILSFGTGEPDFPTPPHAIEAAHRAALDGQTNYPPTQGTPALRAAIAEDNARWTGVRPDPGEIIVSTGAKQVISNAFLATVDPGDEVIVPTPYWTTYADTVATCEGVLVPRATSAETGFRITPADLAAAITPRTRWLMLNTPGNPSGALYGADDLVALAKVLADHPQVMVLSDEIYQHIAYRPFTSFRVAAPELAGRMLIVNGVSKAYSMTGWRLGWGIGPAELIRAMVAIQGQSTSGASSISQAAALGALTGPQDLLAERRAAFRARRDFVLERINATGRLHCDEPGGAFYLFPACTGTFGCCTPAGQKIETDADFCQYLLHEAGVAVVPGRAFGLSGHFRLSYAYSQGDLAEGCRRIAAAVAALED